MASNPSLVALKGLRDDGVLALVGLPSAAVCPASWRHGQKPSPSLPIDKAIEALLARDRLPKVPQGRRSERSCPYYQGRFFAAWAAVNASTEEAEWERTYKLRLTKLEAVGKRSLDAHKQFGLLTAALQGLSFSPSPAPGARLDCDDHESNYAAKDFLQRVEPDVIKAFAEVREAALRTAGALKKEKKRDDFQAWHAAFAFRIGQLWFDLFENVPGRQNGGLFVDLIAKAFESVCSDHASWDRAMSAAFDRHEAARPGDGFDRYFNRAVQPTGLTGDEIAAARRENAGRLHDNLSADRAAEEESARQIRSRLMLD